MFLTSKTRSAYLLGKAKAWRQLHTNETCCRQTSLVNVVVGFLTNDSDDLKTICLNGSIVAESGTAEAQSRAIISAFQESASLLSAWRDEMSAMLPNQLELSDMIPEPSNMDITCMLGGMIEHDTCNHHSINLLLWIY